MNAAEVIVDGDNILQEDGSLEMPWVDWHPGDTKVSLDGYFTAAELRAIADHMDSYGKVLL